MKRVLLVNTNTEKSPYPVPPVGLCILASQLNCDYEVRLYDGVFDEGESLVNLVEQFRPHFIGFSIRNIDDVVADRVVFYPDEIIEKFILPVNRVSDATVILGGSGFSMFPVELMEMTGADFGIVGDATGLLSELLEILPTDGDLSGIPGLIVKGDRDVRYERPSGKMKIIAPRYSEIDKWVDFNQYKAKGVYSVQTKRGCSHGCIYCTYPIIEGRTFQTRTATDIVNEIEQAARRLGEVTFEFVDSTFNDPRGHAESICREIIRRGLKVRLRTMGMNPRHVTAELLELMCRAGFAQIDATPDSASSVMLKNLGKGFTIKQVEKMARLIREFDLPTMWFFLFGGPGENEATFNESISFIDTFVSSKDLVYLNAGLRIYPSTPLYHLAVREGKISAGQAMLYPPVYYFSDLLDRHHLDELIHRVAGERHNLIPANQTSPSPQILKAAINLRTKEQLTEPMFRTLLRIRKAFKADPTNEKCSLLQ